MDWKSSWSQGQSFETDSGFWTFCLEHPVLLVKISATKRQFACVWDLDPTTFLCHVYVSSGWILSLPLLFSINDCNFFCLTVIYINHILQWVRPVCQNKYYAFQFFNGAYHFYHVWLDSKREFKVKNGSDLFTVHVLSQHIEDSFLAISQCDLWGHPGIPHLIIHLHSCCICFLFHALRPLNFHIFKYFVF